MNVPAILLLDIEGTTTPIDFVTTVLFCYARDHVGEFLNGLDQDTYQELTEGLRDEFLAEKDDASFLPMWLKESSREGAVDYLLWLMALDRKSPTLKRIQGHVWQCGYRTGELRGIVYRDVPPALKRLAERGVRIAIYSSGSVLTQKLLFSTTEHGDLTHYICAYFDTEVGGKLDPESYHHIADRLAVTTAREKILFLSAEPAELVAAREAGLSVTQCVRPGTMPDASFPIISDFSDLG